MNEQQPSILNLWETAIRTAQRANYRAASHYEHLNYGLGIPVVLLTTVVGTSVFSAIGNDPSKTAQITVGFMSVAAAVLSAVHTFLRFSERPDKHRMVAISYSALQKAIGQILAGPPANDTELEKRINAFRSSWDKVAKEAPTVPQPISERTLKEEQGGQQISMPAEGQS
jgi:hypothetical protein